ncbi:MAG: hypothetical protein ACLSGA_04975 [Ruminococcus sp.]
MKKKCVTMLLITIMTASLAGCGSSKDGSGKSVKLDPDHPVSLTIWHYITVPNRQCLTPL